MALLPLPTAGAVLGAGRSLVSWAGEVVDVAAGLPARVDGLLGEVTRLVGTLGSAAERVDGLLGRADALVDELDALLVRVRRVAVEAEEVVGSARSITAGADEVVGAARSITAGAEEVVDGARAITGGASEVVDSARAVTTGAEEVVDGARAVTHGAEEVVGSAGTTSRSAQELLTTYEPMLRRGAPLAEKFVADLTPEEVDAAIRLVDQLPVLTDHMVTDIMPILETLDRVGPDIHELLGVTKELRQAIDGIPGLGFLKKRGAAKDDED